MDDRLVPAQAAALAHVRASAESKRAAVRRRIAAAAPGAAATEWVAALRRHRRVTVNFHPDRVVAGGLVVAEALRDQGSYRSQFETKISNGGLTAFPGGDRDRWEQDLFGGAYQAAGSDGAERPKYGGLNVLDDPDGACPRYGSCHLRLAPAVFDRCTFSFGDSVTNPEDLGVADAFGPVLAALLESVKESGEVFGRRWKSAGELLQSLGPTSFDPRAAPGRSLDAYIEAQLHGPLDLARDVEALVIDRAYERDPLGLVFQSLAERYAVPLLWIPGLALDAAEVPAEFRGERTLRAGAPWVQARFGRRGCLDAPTLGRAAASVVRDPGSWEDWDSPDQCLQQIKYLWHTLVAYGVVDTP